MPTTNFTTKFDLTQSPPQIIITDTSNWIGQGIPLANVNDCVKVISPSGTPIYNNIGAPDVSNFSNANADIRNSAGNTNFGRTIIALPIDTSTGLPELGSYEITVRTYNSVDLVFYDAIVKTYTNEYVRVIPKIEATVDCVSPQFVTKDTTDYVVNGVTPTVLHFMQVAFPNDVLGNVRAIVSTNGYTITLGAGEFYQGLQTTTVISTPVYVFGDGLTVKDHLVFGENTNVDCVNVCGILCCVTDLKDKVTKNCATSEEKQLFFMVMTMLGFIQYSINCGNGANVSTTLDYIKAIIPCSDGCNDCGVTGTPIIGIGTILNNVVVDTGGAPIEVSSVVAGSLTTYYVKLSASFVNSVNTLIAQMLVANANIAYLQLQTTALLAASYTATSSDGSIIIAKAYSVAGSLLKTAGSGYVAADILDVVGGTHSAVAKITVDTVDGSGHILTYHTSTVGAYTVKPANNVSTTYGGAGVGATFFLTWAETDNFGVSKIHIVKAYNATTDVNGVAEYDLFSGGVIAPKTGTYLVMFNADFRVAVGTEVIFGQYFCILNSVLGVNVSTDATLGIIEPPVSAAATAIRGKVSLLTTVTTAADGDVIGVEFNIANVVGGGAKEINNATIVIIGIT